MNHSPVHCQIVIIMITGSAVLASASHGWARLSSPTARRMSLTIPSSAKNSRKTGAMVAGASTVGMKMITLCSVASLTRECMIAASVKPRNVWTTNVTTQNTAVCRSEAQNTGSASMSV